MWNPRGCRCIICPCIHSGSIIAVPCVGPTSIAGSQATALPWTVLPWRPWHSCWLGKLLVGEWSAVRASQLDGGSFVFKFTRQPAAMFLHLAVWSDSVPFEADTNTPFERSCWTPWQSSRSHSMRRVTWLPVLLACRWASSRTLWVLWHPSWTSLEPTLVHLPLGLRCSSRNSSCSRMCRAGRLG